MQTKNNKVSKHNFIKCRCYAISDATTIVSLLEPQRKWRKKENHGKERKSRPSKAKPCLQSRLQLTELPANLDIVCKEQMIERLSEPTQNAAAAGMSL